MSQYLYRIELRHVMCVRRIAIFIFLIRVRMHIDNAVDDMLMGKEANRTSMKDENSEKRHLHYILQPFFHQGIFYVYCFELQSYLHFL